MMDATRNEAEAVLPVFWDISSCPVPHDYDARLVGPCIRRFLKNSFYDCPVTITAVGLLSDVPEDILRAISSTGITLYNGPFGRTDLANVIFKWVSYNPPPANLMVITRPPNASVLDLLSMKGYNTILPGIWEDFLSTDSGALEEDKCSETGESAEWVCGVCDFIDDNGIDAGHFTGRGIESFFTHLATPDHARQFRDSFPLSAKEAEALLPVFWDINSCPVPRDYDARLVGSCIRRFLKNLGYNCPVTITAVGLLSDIPEDILRAISSTGITLYNSPYGGSKDMVHVLFDWTSYNPPPANVMVITRHLPDISFLLIKLLRRGYNSILSCPYPWFYADCIWENLFLKRSFEEDKYSETGEPAEWVCGVCYHGIAGRGIENFLRHLATPYHAIMEDKAKAPLDSYPKGSFTI